MHSGGPSTSQDILDQTLNAAAHVWLVNRWRRLHEETRPTEHAGWILPVSVENRALENYWKDDGGV